MRNVIIDFDGTLTQEELQAASLAQRSLGTLARDILHVPVDELENLYTHTRSLLLQSPHRYGWRVNGLLASYCDEGAFILNTTVLQTMLTGEERYRNEIARAFPAVDYDPVMECVNYLFHHHTAKLEPKFRPGAGELLDRLLRDADYEPMVLTNSLSDKVCRQLSVLGVSAVSVLGDTRQYDMDPVWSHRFPHPTLGDIQLWQVDELHHVDLRRPAYYRALCGVVDDGARAVVVADTFSLPGALPLLMGIPFCLLRTSYTPKWCSCAVATHPCGHVLNGLQDLDKVLQTLDS
jgi:hypothetical protein